MKKYFKICHHNFFEKYKKKLRCKILAFSFLARDLSWIGGLLNFFDDDK